MPRIPFGAFLAMGITVAIGLQVCINMGVTLGLVAHQGIDVAVSQLWRHQPIDQHGGGGDHDEHWSARCQILKPNRVWRPLSVVVAGGRHRRTPVSRYRRGQLPLSAAMTQSRILFVGAGRPLEKAALARAKFPQRVIAIEGIKGRGTVGQAAGRAENSRGRVAFGRASWASGAGRPGDRSGRLFRWTGGPGRLAHPHSGGAVRAKQRPRRDQPDC